MTLPPVAHLAVTLDHVQPPVTRRLAVPLDFRLDRLHLVLQAAFGWTDSHLWEFRARNSRWGPPSRGWSNAPRDARKQTLMGLLEDTGAKTLRYHYDFGDDWEHTIKIPKIADAEPDIAYPVLLEASGCCPPEDIGGPWGYEDFLEGLADPNHESHEVFAEWYPEGFDPEDVPLDDLKSAVAALARRWGRKAPRPRAR